MTAANLDVVVTDPAVPDPDPDAAALTAGLADVVDPLADTVVEAVVEELVEAAVACDAGLAGAGAAAVDAGAVVALSRSAAMGDVNEERLSSSLKMKLLSSSVPGDSNVLTGFSRACFKSADMAANIFWAAEKSTPPMGAGLPVPPKSAGS